MSSTIKLVAILAVAGAALYAAKKIKSVGVENITAAAINTVGEAATGTVLGVGDVLGIPRTDQTRGELAWSEGRYLDASLLLPAKDFIGHVWDELTGTKKTTPSGDIPPFNPAEMYLN